MKTKGLLLLCLFAFISLSINAEHFQKGEKIIRLEKCDSESSNKGKRSITSSETFAYLNSDYELILIDLENSVSNAEVSIISFSTNEIIYSELHSGSDILILNLLGLLHEGEEYRLEITIGDTILYGDFIC